MPWSSPTCASSYHRDLGCSDWSAPHRRCFWAGRAMIIQWYSIEHLISIFQWYATTFYHVASILFSQANNPSGEAHSQIRASWWPWCPEHGRPNALGRSTRSRPREVRSDHDPRALPGTVTSNWETTGRFGTTTHQNTEYKLSLDLMWDFCWFIFLFFVLASFARCFPVGSLFPCILNGFIYKSRISVAYHSVVF